jgi:hypothetical protein
LPRVRSTVQRLPDTKWIYSGIEKYKTRISKKWKFSYNNVGTGQSLEQSLFSISKLRQILKIILNDIRNCPEPYEHHEAGHFVQEWGEEVARKVLMAFEQMALTQAADPAATGSGI